MTTGPSSISSTPASRSGPLRLDHVQLAMPAGGESVAQKFYEGVLGIPRVAKPAPMAARGGAWFEAGPDLRIHLGVEKDFRPARKAHPALAVASLAEMTAALDAAGVAWRPGDEVDGFRQVFVDDPFGNRIEFIERFEGRS